MTVIDKTLAQPEPRTDLFYVDEVDIDLNPKTGFRWSRRGQQKAVPTPGKNRKRYLASALHAPDGQGSGRVFTPAKSTFPSPIEAPVCQKAQTKIYPLHLCWRPHSDSFLVTG